MLKILKIFLSFSLGICLNLYAEDLNSLEYSKEKYPIKSHHAALGFDCKNCHKQANPKEYKALSTKECLSCHKSYELVAERSGHLGYDDNIHASPHYPKMDCNICHKSHRQSQNYCAMCHSQDSMKKISVP